jgi:hypothetical protein
MKPVSDAPSAGGDLMIGANNAALTKLGSYLGQQH